MTIPERLQQILNEIPANIKLVAVSKFQSIEKIMEAYFCGHKIFGESKVQELLEKHDLLPKDIEWHFIGHLQTNKVKYIVPFVHLIHAVDNEKLLIEIDKEAGKIEKKIKVLLQIHIAKEETKFGFSENECRELLETGNYKTLRNVEICGLMGMATYTEDKKIIHQEFYRLALFFNELKQKYFESDETFKELSIGMSDDYPIAIKNGSTLVRIGSKLFGERGFI